MSILFRVGGEGRVRGRRLAMASVLFATVSGCGIDRNGLGVDPSEGGADTSELDSGADDTPIEASDATDTVGSTCTDGIKNGNETDVDCGGPDCLPCADGRDCVSARDCASAVCGTSKKCAAPTCTDGVKNGTETDIDCGGTCPPCMAGQHCAAHADCLTKLCTAANTCQAPASCKALLALKAGLASGPYSIDPDGTGPNPAFDAYCDMTTDSGGWTFFAHVNNDYTASTLFEADVGTYRSDRVDDNTTYSRGGTILKYIGHTAMMISLDDPDPTKAAGASKIVGFSYTVGDGGFNKGPVPCSGLTTGFGYRTALTGAYVPGGIAVSCNAGEWYTRVATGAADKNLIVFYSNPPNGGAYWGGGMGGDSSFKHEAYLYVR